jgi:hypothetical protein
MMAKCPSIYNRRSEGERCDHWNDRDRFPELSPAVQNRLYREGWHSEDALLAATDAEILDTPWIGRVTLAAVRAVYPHCSPTDFVINELRALRVA